MQVWEVPFRGANLLGVKQDGKIYVPIKPICAAIGIDMQAQTRRISRDPVLKKGVAMMAIPFTAGGPQAMFCLPLNRIHYWLAGVDSSRIKDEDMKRRVIEYQEECADVLFAYFMPVYAQALGIKLPIQQARVLHEDLFDRGDIEILEPELTAHTETEGFEPARRDDALAAKQAASEARDAAIRSEGVSTQARDASMRTEKTIVEISARGRKRPTKEAILCAKYIIWNKYNGFCPCGCGTLLMKSPHELISVGQNHRCIAEWDHLPSHKNSGKPEYGWYVYSQCNQQLKDPELRDRKWKRWIAYQEHVNDYFREQKKGLF